MVRTRQRLVLVLVAVAGVGAWIAGRGPSSTPLPDEPASPDEPRPAPPLEIRGPVGPDDGRGSGLAPGARGQPTPPSSPPSLAATVERRITVRLADGRVATSGVVVWNARRPGSATDGGSAEAIVVSAEIGGDGTATLRMPDRVARWDGTLSTAAAGEPNTSRAFVGGLPADPLVVEVPPGVRVAFTARDPTGAPIPNLPILVTGGGLARYFLTEADFDLATIASRRGDQNVCVETATDAFGRVDVRVPAEPGHDGTSAAVGARSRSPAWFGSFESFYVPPGGRPHPARSLRFEPGVAVELRAVDRRSGLPVAAGYVRLFPGAGSRSGGFGDEFAPVNTRIRVARGGPETDVWRARVVLTSRTHVPAVATVTIPAGLHESRVDFALDRADDADAKGHVELTVPRADGEPGKETPWSLEVGVADATPPIRVDILDATTWAAADRIDASLPPGRWRLRLLPAGRNSIAWEATVDLAARVTTRATLAVPPEGTAVR